MILKSRTLGAGFLLIALAAGPASALECPLPQMKASEGVLKETPAAIAADSKILAGGGSEAVPTIVFGLRQRHPRSSNGAILNYLLTAYCPVVNRMSRLSEKQKRAILTRFGSQVIAGQPH
ncbi:MAG: hypothetical protein ABI216_00370 [Devosia sp.]